MPPTSDGCSDHCDDDSDSDQETKEAHNAKDAATTTMEANKKTNTAPRKEGGYTSSFADNEDEKTQADPQKKASNTKRKGTTTSTKQVEAKGKTAKENSTTAVREHH